MPVDPDVLSMGLTWNTGENQDARRPLTERAANSLQQPVAQISTQGFTTAPAAPTTLPELVSKLLALREITAGTQSTMPIILVFAWLFIASVANWCCLAQSVRCTRQGTPPGTQHCNARSFQQLWEEGDKVPLSWVSILPM